MAEPFHWRLIERGDRIGHGIAITLDPMKWWERNKGKVFSVKRFDRLLDLAFLAEYASEERSPDQEKWLRMQIEKIVGPMRLPLKLKTADPSEDNQDVVKIAKALWKAIGAGTMRKLIGTLERPGNLAHENWLHRYLWDRSVQQRAGDEVTLLVDDDRNERNLLVKARAKLIQELARWQVCIESNPSSNLVVGSLDAIAAQDFLARRPTGVAAAGKETLTWTISTDDPITFSTTLADEYAYAWAGMVLRHDNPYDPSYARAVLDEAAATSMRMRFTVPPHDVNPSAWKQGS